ncbi:hypothetical protein LZ30DRAFT_777924 [Colletotrichum cereale]|nr:hypothetical protein LZ30DRAFT_777924 [Colletotrichum cereale]
MAEQSSTADDGSFKSVKFNSEPEVLRQFDETFSVQHAGRRERLRNLHAKRMKKLQSKNEATANSAVLTKAILALFERLDNWEGADIKLGLSVASSTDSD